jgi:hypothetical protein
VGEVADCSDTESEADGLKDSCLLNILEGKSAGPKTTKTVATKSSSVAPLPPNASSVAAKASSAGVAPVVAPVPDVVAGVAPVVAPVVGAVAPVVVAAVALPVPDMAQAAKLSGDFTAVAIEGGFLRFSKNLGRLDAHCKQANHGPGCKLDRSLRKRVLGLSSLWLAAKCDTKADHDSLKSELSRALHYAARCEARDRFVARAAAEGGVLHDIVEEEFAISGELMRPVVEPATIA